jgi:hypothetical protein
MLFHLSAASVFLVILFCTSSIPQRNNANEPSAGIQSTSTLTTLGPYLTFIPHFSLGTLYTIIDFLI